MDSTYRAFIVIGSLVIVVSLFLFIKTKVFIDNASVVSGKVVQLIESHNEDEAICFTAVFSYTDSKKIAKKIHSKTCLYPPIFSIGDKVNLLFDENNPDASIIEDEWFALWGADAILTGIGCIFLLLGSLGIFLRYLYKKNK